MKKLYIRFFDNRGNEVPRDSHVVCDGECGGADAQKLIACYAGEVVEWMSFHPDGKVDYVWL